MSEEQQYRYNRKSLIEMATRSGARSASLLVLLAIALPLLGTALVVSAESLVEVEPDVDLSLPSEPDGLEQVEEPGSVLPNQDTGAPFQSIPNFAVSQGSMDVKVGSRIECQDVCLDRKEYCNSVSYRARDNKCLLTDVVLTIKHGWALLIKNKIMNDVGLMKPTGKYRKFDNMLFEDPKYKRVTGDPDTCKQLCSDDENCGSFSFQQKTQTCQLGGPGVTFDPEYAYYERNTGDLNPENPVEQSGDQESDLPETVKEEGDSKKAKESIHIVPPQVQRLNAKLAEQAEKIRQMSISINSNKLDPRFSTDPIKEKRGKDVLRKEEKEKEMMFDLKQQTRNSILGILAATNQLKQQARGVAKEGKIKTLTVAKSSFVAGEQASAEEGKKDFQRELEKLTKQMKAAGGATAGDDPAMRKKETRLKYMKKERKDMVKRKGVMRSKELDIKHTKRDEALALSKKVSHLVNDERDTKVAKTRTIELSYKANKAANTKTIMEAMDERNQKKVNQMNTVTTQNKVDQKFNLALLGDKSQRMQEDLAFRVQQRKVENTLKREQEGRQKLKEASSGAKERGQKDEKKGADNERAQKIANGR